MRCCICDDDKYIVAESFTRFGGAISPAHLFYCKKHYHQGKGLVFNTKFRMMQGWERYVLPKIYTPTRIFYKKTN
jgi:hypothetical protein